MLTDQPAGIGRLEHAATIGVVLLALGSFVLSYDALHQLAVDNHVPRPLAWIWPLIVDGFIITASLAVLHATLTSRPATYPWLLVLAFSGTSVVFNVLHAPPTVVARLVAAIPPLTLVLSFELLMRQLRHRLTTRPYLVAIAEQPRQEPAISNAVPSQASAESLGRSIREKVQDLRREHEQDGRTLTGKGLAEILGISDGYARRLLREIRADAAPKRMAAS
jgi:hypothetical protein